MSDSAEWPVVLTNRCADACSEVFGLGGRDAARDWLRTLIDEQGRVTDELPEPVSGRRSPSGYFVLVADTLILSLAEDSDHGSQWIATNCIGLPGRRGGAAQPDLSKLAGPELLDQVTFLPHAVERFQQRGGGNPNAERAREELIDVLAPTVRAARQPPSWCRTREAEFYLIAGDHQQFCLPCRPGGGARPFDVITCLHRASDLFEFDAASLAVSIRFDPNRIPHGGKEEHLIRAEFRRGAHLSWHRPSWARLGSQVPEATWWIVFRNRVAAPVTWQPEHEGTPLLVQGLADHRGFLARLVDRFRH